MTDELEHLTRAGWVQCIDVQRAALLRACCRYTRYSRRAVVAKLARGCVLRCGPDWDDLIRLPAARSKQNGRTK